MDKSNVIRSSEFFMAEGDILHYILIVDSGVSPTISLVSTGDIANSEEAPDAVVALDASDITSSSFTANWYFIENASAYYLDVATDSAFTSFVAGYNNLSVGYVKEYPVVGLTDAYTYYYRVRGANFIGTGDSSNTITTTTANEVVTDADGNVYTYVTIGTQQWMVENWRSTKYADNTPIPNLTASAYTDWFLPSKDELQEMYDELKAYGVGNFALVDYCSSSEFNINECWRLESAETTCTVGVKGNGYNVKPIRAFTSTTVYSLRDTGPSGGLIFYKNGNNYLEASLTNIPNQPFSDNHFPYILVGTDTAIGTGQANTTAIVIAEGAISSAAKTCDDLSSGGWINDTTGAYCAYNNDPTKIADYGLLYNWYAVDNAHGLAPAGWRVPSKADFDALITYLGGDSVAGGKLKEIGLTHWTSPNTGATDEYGFKALPAGQRIVSGAFLDVNNASYCWATDVALYALYLKYNGANSDILGSDDISDITGLSVRMMRDV